MGELTKEEYLIEREKYATIQEGHTHEIKSLKHRVSAVENMTKELQDMNVNLKLMVQKMDAHQAELQEQGNRICCLESAPGKKWDLIINTIIGVIVGALGTMVVQAIVNSVSR